MYVPALLALILLIGANPQAIHLLPPPWTHRPRNAPQRGEARDHSPCLAAGEGVLLPFPSPAASGPCSVREGLGANHFRTEGRSARRLPRSRAAHRLAVRGCARRRAGRPSPRLRTCFHLISLAPSPASGRPPIDARPPGSSRATVGRRSPNAPGTGADGRKGAGVAVSKKSPDARPRPQYRQPRLAEMIAGELRNRILGGDYFCGPTFNPQTGYPPISPRPWPQARR
jgi:hypothetical protein